MKNGKKANSYLSIHTSRFGCLPTLGNYFGIRYFVILVLALCLGCVSAQTALQDAHKVDTVEAYDDFLKRFPDDKLSAKARDWREDALYREVSLQNTLEGYKVYLKEYPNGKYAGQIKEEIEKLLWQKAQTNQTAVEYEKYLSLYPEGRYASEAKSKLELIYWHKATREKTESAYSDYLDKYPNGRYAAEARKERETAAWRATKDSKYISDFVYYLKVNPKGTYSEKAKEKIAKLAGEDFLPKCIATEDNLTEQESNQFKEIIALRGKSKDITLLLKMGTVKNFV